MSIRRTYDPLEPSFKVFHELMGRRVGEILLVSSPYDAFVMEEDGRLAGRIVNEYRGLNLSRPPRITWAASAAEALGLLGRSKFDLVVSMTRLQDMPAAKLCAEITMTQPDLSLCLLSHQADPLVPTEQEHCRRFVWMGNTDLLLALIKSTEDRWNVDYDTRAAGVRVILLVEDSALYRSSLLPFLYKEIVRQTQSVMDESLNEEHRILRMRARPKILLAGSYEAALSIYQQYSAFMLAVLSDASFPLDGAVEKAAGLELLAGIRRQDPELPLLLFSSEPSNRAKAQSLGVQFIDKNAPDLHQELRSFFVRFLGFEEFVFRTPEGAEVGRAASLRAMARVLDSVPDRSIEYHARREDFSTWMMARMEVELAGRLRALKVGDFSGIPEVRTFIRDAIVSLRKERQRGIVVDFGGDYDPSAEFVKIGSGSLGGKARGLAFMASMLKTAPELENRYPTVRIRIPRTVVLSTECFDAYLQANRLSPAGLAQMPDQEIANAFAAGVFPEELAARLSSFIAAVDTPLAVRSSSLHEDARAQPSAGVYKTLMIPNHQTHPQVRLARLLQAVQRVFASTYFDAARAFAARSPYRTEEDRMAVILQPVVGQTVGGWHYPAISGVAQSTNFYPMAPMKPEEGVAHIALGLGRTIVEGHACLRFSPRYPQLLPQVDTVPEALQNAQRAFFALRMPRPEEEPVDLDGLLERRTVDEMAHHPVVQLLASTYVEADQRIRETGRGPGPKLITFASVLKHGLLPLAQIVAELLEMGRKGLGCAVEIEFAVDLPAAAGRSFTFWLLQIRPMAQREQSVAVAITAEDERRAVCCSRHALGNGLVQEIRDILVVPPGRFDPGHTIDIADQIARLNRLLERQGRRYVLIGPGRWGSADRRLGIPVAWKEISAVAAIVETEAAHLNADPSQGSHFFHNITTSGTGYLTVAARLGGRIDWDRLMRLPAAHESTYVRHVLLEKELQIKIDGHSSRGVILLPEEQAPA